MKDRQAPPDQEKGYLPVISPVLHVLTMPAIVFLRRNFGYLYLRPKSIFLSLCWAYVLYSIYSWFEPARWQRNPMASWFALLATVLYLIHLGKSVSAQFGRAPHDRHSGDPWLAVSRANPAVVVLWVEPALLVLGSGLLRFVWKGDALSAYLLISGGALWIKEAINQWAGIRKTKRQIDVTTDADETMGKMLDAEPSFSTKGDTRAANTSRRSRVKRARQAASSEGDLVETHAAVLRMIPPYSLEQAEKNYRALAKQSHPDRNDTEEGEGRAMQKLTEAVEFFRTHFR